MAVPVTTNSFHWADYLVFALTLVISAVIGIYYAYKDKKRQNSAEFLLGGRKMSTFPVTLSLMASFLSAVMVLGVPTEIFAHGTMYWLIAFSNILTFPMAAHAFLPVFHNLRLSSAYEYLDLRFNRVVRVMGSLVFQLQMILYMAVVLYAPALAVNEVMGIDIAVSIVVIGVVCTFYTAIGGLKAVMWTDVFQMMIVFAGLLTLTIKGTIEVGGFHKVWDTANNASKIHADNFSVDPTVRSTFWTLIIGGFVTSMTIYGSNQAMIQRYLSMANVRSAQVALYWNLPASIILTSLLVYMGLVMYGEYPGQQATGPCGLVDKRDQLIPKLVMDVLGTFHGLPGLIVSCIFSASLSTVSSGVNALALVFLTDIVKPLYRRSAGKDMADARATVVSKILAIIFGLLTIALAYVAGEMGDLILQIALSIFGMVGGPLLGVFVVALFFPVVNSWGAGVGLVCSLGFSFFLVIGSIVHRQNKAVTMVTASCNDSGIPSLYGNTTSVLPWTTSASLVTSTMETSTASSTVSGLDHFYSISYLWYSTLAVLVCVIVGLVVSLFTGGTRKKPVDPRLLSPLFVWFASFASTKISAVESDIEISIEAASKNTENGDVYIADRIAHRRTSTTEDL